MAAMASGVYAKPNGTRSVAPFKLDACLSGNYKASVSYLNDFCQKNKLPYPEYVPCETANGRYSFYVKLEKDTVFPKGNSSESIKDAKQFAAFVALEEILKEKCFNHTDFCVSSEKNGHDTHIVHNLMSADLATFLKGDCFHAITYLNNYCQKNRLPYPEYIACHSAFKFSFHVKLGGVNYPNGSFSPILKDAKRLAAVEALKRILKNTQNRVSNETAQHLEIDDSVSINKEPILVKPLTSSWSTVVANGTKQPVVRVSEICIQSKQSGVDSGTNSTEIKAQKPSAKLRKLASLFANGKMVSKTDCSVKGPTNYSTLNYSM